MVGRSSRILVGLRLVLEVHCKWDAKRFYCLNMTFGFLDWPPGFRVLFSCEKNIDADTILDEGSVLLFFLQDGGRRERATEATLMGNW